MGIRSEGFLPTSGGRASLNVPGSKSESNRALVCAALAQGPSVLRGLADGDDVVRMLAGLRLMGLSAVTELDGTVRIDAGLDREAPDAIVVDCGLAGTTSRFLTALAVLRRGDTVITGEAGLRRRPMAELHELLRQLGVTVESNDGRLPTTIRGGAFRNRPRSDQSEGATRHLVTRGDTSSQFVSALMMIAPLIDGLRVELPCDMVSRNYLEMTAGIMRKFGAEVAVKETSVIVQASSYAGADVRIQGDWSSASYPFAAAAITGGEATVTNLARGGIQPEEAFCEVLEKMGCDVVAHDQGVTVRRPAQSALVGVEVNMSEMSDLVPTLAVMAACATTPTAITGVGFIRSKESDRLGDLAFELRKCGAKVEVLADGLRIDPTPMHGATIDPHDDHRLAMALSLLGLRVPGVVVSEPEVVGKSWPGYWTEMRRGFRT